MKEQKYFSVAEIVNIAVTIEQKGQEFYKSLLEKFDNPELQRVFSMLLQDEINHEELFKNLYKEVAENKENLQPRQSEILEALADSHLFLNPEKLEKRVGPMKIAADALEMAIDFEKDSVVFFSGIKEFVTDDKNGVVEKLAKEEMLHVVKLLDLKRELM